jgi:cytochrome c-type biogenesis protein
MEMTETVSLMIAFSAGLLSFASPCVLPLVPSYLVYISGLSLDTLIQEEQSSNAKWKMIQRSVVFIVGFSIVFILFGASATAIGQLMLAYQDIIRQVGGVLIVFFGLYVMGILKAPFLMFEKRIHLREGAIGYVGLLLAGMAFAAGWTPCVGPVLGSILLLASTSESVSQGIGLLAAYSLGLAFPLLIASLSLNAFLMRFTQIKPYLGVVSRISGLFLIVIGVMLITNYFTVLTGLLTEYGIGWNIGQ